MRLASSPLPESSPSPAPPGRAALAACLALLLAALGLGALGGARASAAPTLQDPIPRNRLSPCSGTVTNTIRADAIELCEQNEITVTLQPTCPVCPNGINVVFVQIEVAPQSRWQNEESLRAYETMLNMVDENATVNVGVIHYNRDDTRTVLQMTDREGTIKGRLRQTQTGYEPRGLAIRKASAQGVRMIRQANSGQTVEGAEPCEFMVIFGYTKSHYEDQRRAMLEAARQARSAGITLFVGCPQDPGAWYCRVTPEMAGSRRYHTQFNERNRLAQMADRELRDLLEEIDLRTLSLSQLLPPGIDYIEGSAEVSEEDFADEPTEIERTDEGTRLTWIWEQVGGIQPGYTLTYGVEPLALGEHTITGWMELEDSNRKRANAVAPELGFAAAIECPTATPTPPSTPTPTTTPTSTATDTPVPTPTVTMTPTPSTYVVYLPIARSDEEECVPESVYTDVVVVLDMSTSMYRETRDGRTKHEAAIAAAMAFADQLDLTPDGLGRRDRMGVAGFNDEAWTQLGLSADREAIDGALAGLLERVQQGTRIDLAFQEGQAILDATERIGGSRPTMIVLTDGLPNRVPFPPGGRQEDTVLAAAAAAKDAGTRVFTVGLGVADDVLHDLLREAASQPRDFYFAPDGEDLLGIYRQIAGRIVECR